MITGKGCAERFFENPFSKKFCVDWANEFGEGGEKLCFFKRLLVALGKSGKNKILNLKKRTAAFSIGCCSFLVGSIVRECGNVLPSNHHAEYGVNRKNIISIIKPNGSVIF